MKNMEIAIIGMAGRFPDAPDAESLFSNLSEGRNSIKKPPLERLLNTSIDPNQDFKYGGFMDDVEYFDHHFFNLSYNEAAHMDPVQRLCMEVAYEAIENTGFSVDHFNGSNTSVFVGDTDLDYTHFIEKKDPTAVTNMLSAMISGRIARFFNLRGSAITVGSSCSSSLVAIHHACNELILGERDYALVMGCRLYIYPPRVNQDKLDIGVNTNSNKLSSFSADANGTIFGEAAGCVLLTPLTKAVEDRHIIHAVIKGSAVNQDAALSGSLTAPDSIAQSEVIRSAWERSGIDPLTISFIEAHGTGTELGDPIEIQGINLAFQAYTDQKSFCALSTVKPNIGHADSASGISGLIKAVLSLKHRKILPSINFEKPNPFIDFDNSAVYVNTEFKDWEVPLGVPRRAGVSSFGLSGTNSHVILEEAPKIEQPVQQKPVPRHVVTVSAKDEKSLQANIEVLQAYIEAQPTLSLKDIAYTLTVGRKHYDYRFAAVVDSREELLLSLKDAKTKAVLPGRNKKAIFIFSDGVSEVQQLIQNFSATSELFNEHYQRALTTLEEHVILEKSTTEARNNFLSLVFQYSLFQMIDNGSRNRFLLGVGIGKIVVSLLSRDITWNEAVQQIHTYIRTPSENLRERCVKLIDGHSDMPVLYVEVGTPSAISRMLMNLSSSTTVEYQVLTVADNLSLEHYVHALYIHHYAFTWSQILSSSGAKRIELPSYQFNKIRCWVYDPISIADGDSTILTFENDPVFEEPGLGDGFIFKKEWTELQNQIGSIWYDIFKSNSLSLEDDFFEIGGHSLYGNKVVNKIQKVFNVEFEFEELFDHATIAAIASRVEELLAEARIIPYETIKPTAIAGDYELSHAQRRLWVLDQMEHDYNYAYNMYDMFALDELDTLSFTNAIQYCIYRHEILRTIFVLHDNIPKQKIKPKLNVRDVIEITDLRETEATPALLQDLIADKVQTLFDLTTGPLFKLFVFQLQDQVVVLFLIHHIISDGTSIELMIKEITMLYECYKSNTTIDLAPLTIQYKDYTSWQNKILEDEENSQDKYFWLNQFKDIPEPLNLPTDYLRPQIRTYQGDSMRVAIDQEIVSKIYAFMAQHDVTLFMLLLSVLKTLLFRYTRQSDFVIGTPVSGRYHADLENQLGCYVNTLALRTKFSRGQSFLELLQKVRSVTLDAIAHQGYPFDKLVGELDLQRDLSRNPLFDVFMSLHHSDIDKSNMMNEEIRLKNNLSKFDLTFNFIEYAQSIELDIEFNTSLYKIETVRNIGRHFCNLLKKVLQSEAMSLDILRFLDEEEVHSFLHVFNQPVEDDESDLTITQLFEEQVENTPDATAVVYQEKLLTYRELNQRSNQLAYYLRDIYGIKANDLVGICLDRSELMIISILAVLKSGGGYVPIDLQNPDERRNYLIHDSRVKCVLTNADIFGDLEISAINLSEKKHEISKKPVLNPSCTNTPQDIAYVMYTSGSSGKPKGVVVGHESVVNLLNNLGAIPGMNAEDRIMAVSSFGFDISIVELILPLVRGATTYIVDRQLLFDVKKLIDYCDEVQPTWMQTTPSLWNMLINNGWRGTKDMVIISGGEKLSRELANDLLSCSKNVWNMYGPTETTIWVTISPVKSHGEVDIGSPLKNTHVYILDENNEFVPSGVAGEICIGGKCLALGYHHKDVLRKKSFVENPFRKEEEMYRTGDIGFWDSKGKIRHLGRIDNQIKLNGHRIELGEIENTLLQYDSITAAHVLVFKKDKTPLLCCYYQSHKELPEETLKAYLSSQLPHYMIPQFLIKLSQFPTTINGKVDESRLPKPENLLIQVQYVAPRNEIEVEITNMWKEVLEVERIGIRDNFFTLGGNSIRAITLAFHLQKIDKQIQVKDIFQQLTIENIAGLMEDRKLHKTEQAPEQDREQDIIRELDKLEDQYTHDRKLERISKHLLSSKVGASRLIERVWQKGLEREEIHPDADFIELCDRSWVKIFYVAEIFEKLGIELTLEALFKYRRIHELSEYICNPLSNGEEHVVLLNDYHYTNLSSVFFIPTAIGLPLTYWSLAKQMQEYFNCFSLFFSGFDGEPIQSLPDITDKFVRAINKVSASGEIILVGYSWSVSLAFELCKQIENTGRPTKLIILDMHTNHQLNDLTPVLSIEEVTAEFDQQTNDIPADYAKKLKRVFLGNSKLFSSEYRTKGQLKSDIMAIQAEDNIQPSHMEIWNNHTSGQFVHHYCKGDHWSILDEKNIPSLAETILKFAQTHHLII